MFCRRWECYRYPLGFGFQERKIGRGGPHRNCGGGQRKRRHTGRRESTGLVSAVAIVALRCRWQAILFFLGGLVRFLFMGFHLGIGGPATLPY